MAACVYNCQCVLFCENESLNERKWLDQIYSPETKKKKKDYLDKSQMNAKPCV